MKKLLLLSSVIISIAANAQRIGFTGGASFANYKSKIDGESDNGNSKTGFTAGLLVDLSLGDHFSFQPALNFVQKGTKDEQTLAGITEKVSLTANHLEIPLNILYNTNGDAGNFFIGAGPSLAFGLSGKWKFEDNTSSLTENVKFGSNEDEDDLKGLDLGANFLAGYCFPNGLFLSANYNLGLSNLAPGGNSDATLKSNYFGVKLGYLLKGKTKEKK